MSLAFPVRRKYAATDGLGKMPSFGTLNVPVVYGCIKEAVTRNLTLGFVINVGSILEQLRGLR